MRTYVHKDGRRCIFDSHGHRWMHYDHEPPEPKPSERRSYICERIHLPEQIVTTEPDAEVIEAEDDRGDFGMPTLGTIMRPLLAAEGMRIVNRDGKRTWMTLMVEPRTALAERIIAQHAPAALEHFLRRNAEYGDDNDFNLGVAGQYVDISRKVQKLKRRWWENEPAKDGEESDETIVMELIGHLLMALDMLEERDGIKEEAPEG